MLLSISVELILCALLVVNVAVCVCCLFAIYFMTNRLNDIHGTLDNQLFFLDRYPRVCPKRSESEESVVRIANKCECQEHPKELEEIPEGDGK